MNVKDEILSDAIECAITSEREVERLTRIAIILGFVCMLEASLIVILGICIW